MLDGVPRCSGLVATTALIGGVDSVDLSAGGDSFVGCH